MTRKSVSERLQLKFLQETNPEEFQVQDHCILFFPTEVRYSLVETKSLGDEIPPLMSVVHVKDGNRKHKATLMFIGTHRHCVRKMEELETCLDGDENHERPPPTIAKKPQKLSKKDFADLSLENDLGEKFKKLEKLSSLPKKISEEAKQETCESSSDEEVENLNDTWKKDVNRKLDRILVMLEGIHPIKAASDMREVLNVTPPMKVKVKQSSPVDGAVSDSLVRSTSCPSLIYNETNLLALSSGGDSKKYAFKVFKVLFSDSEMAGGMVGPVHRVKTIGKVVLDEERVGLLKQAIKEMFGDGTLEKKWPSIRQSLNQKCLDEKRKMLKLDTSASNSDLPAADD